jgi:hypothetical protein
LKHDQEIHDLRDAIEEERRKTMADERKIQEIQKMLDQKVKIAN